MAKVSYQRSDDSGIIEGSFNESSNSSDLAATVETIVTDVGDGFQVVNSINSQESKVEETTRKRGVGRPRKN